MPFIPNSPPFLKWDFELFDTREKIILNKTYWQVSWKFLWTPVFLLKGFSSAFYKKTPISTYDALGYSQPISMAVADMTQEAYSVHTFLVRMVHMQKKKGIMWKLGKLGKSSKRKNVKASNCEKNYLLASFW